MTSLDFGWMAEQQGGVVWEVFLSLSRYQCAHIKKAGKVPAGPPANMVNTFVVDSLEIRAALAGYTGNVMSVRGPPARLLLASTPHTKWEHST